MPYLRLQVLCRACQQEALRFPYQYRRTCHPLCIQMGQIQRLLQQQAGLLNYPA